MFKIMKMTKYLPRKVFAALTKLGSLFLTNVILFANSVIDTVLVGCKCPFRSQIRLKLSPPLPHSLKYFLCCPHIRCFRDIKFSMTNENYILLLLKYNFIVDQQHATFKLNT